eukprot:COSAG03_NODE_16699_length_394_cov_1.237288_1_plen_91_part_10
MAAVAPFRLRFLLLAAAAYLLSLAQAEHGSAAAAPLLPPGAASRVFYVDPQGSDSAAGTSPGSAWKSVSRVNSESLKPGDRVLFKRGGEWR